MASGLIFFPWILAALAWIIPSNRYRIYLVPFAGIFHTVATVFILTRPDLQVINSYLTLDAPGRLVLLTVSVLYLCCSIYAVGYLNNHLDRPNKGFCSFMLAFLGMMTLVTWSQHLGLMWVAMEATTLTTAPLIYFNYHERSIEATWKYLLICSVGIALALLGTFCLAYASIKGGGTPSLFIPDLLASAPLLSKEWLKISFVFILVGYGTKMGLAPMHTWKPDAYGEASGIVGALLAGGLTNCAFLALLRIYTINRAAGDFSSSHHLLLIMGLLSMAAAAVFMMGQTDIKRMLAYSSVEHMGLITLGLGLGGSASWGAMFHLVNNGLTKGMLFLAAGNITHAFGGKSLTDIKGALKLLPLSAGLFLVGFIAITGSPPFSPFISEFMILNGSFLTGNYLVGGLLLLFLLIVFIGMGRTVLTALQGHRAESTEPTETLKESALTVLPILVLFALILVLGIFMPEPLRHLIQDAQSYLEVNHG